jgi:hypothetical protein
VSPVKYELDFYIPEDDILYELQFHVQTETRSFCVIHKGRNSVSILIGYGLDYRRIGDRCISGLVYVLFEMELLPVLGFRNVGKIGLGIIPLR